MVDHNVWHEMKLAVEQAGGRAAKLRRADLHVHSPESHDFGAMPSTLSRDDYRSCARWLLESVVREKPDLQVLGVTDHFKCRTACEAAHLGPAEFGLLVLPGMELAIRCTEFHDDEIHLLILFPPSQPETVYSLVDALGGPPYDQGGTGSCIDRRVGEVLQQAAQRGALCIAAHVNSSDGVRHFIRKTSLELLDAKRREQQLREKTSLTSEEQGELRRLVQRLTAVENQIQERYLTFLGTSDVGAVQIQAAEEALHYASEHSAPLGVRSVACVLASDAHAVEDVAAPGKATLLRTGDLSFRAVQAALGDPQTRVRFSCPPQDRILIRGIQFARVDGTGGGFFGDAAIAFSENLTCIIGPRGSGKSAVIEAIRFALGHPLHREEKLRIEAEQRLQSVLRDTSVRLWVSPPVQDDLVVQRGLATPPEPHDSDGALLGMDPASSAATQVVTYGWSEIEQLGRDWAAQRELIDGAGTELRDLRKDVSDAQSVLQGNRNEAVAAARQIAQYSSELADLPDLQRQMQALDTPELRTAFESSDRASRAESLVAQAAAQLEDVVGTLVDRETGQSVDVAGAIGSQVENLISEAERESLQLPSALTSPEFAAARDRVVTALGETQTALSVFVRLLSEAKQAAATNTAEAKEAAERQLLEAFREDIEAGTETEESVRRKADRRNEIKERRDELLEIEHRRDQERTRLAELLSHRAGSLVRSLQEALGRVSAWRDSKAREITERLAQFAARAPVSVEILPLGDRSQFAIRLYDSENDEGLLKRSRIHAFSERNLAGAVAEAFLPWELVQAIQSEDTERVEDVFGRDGRGDPAQDTRRLLERLQPRPENADDYDPDRLDLALQIEEILVDDKPVIMLEDAPIETLSPGQRCTALMPIILTEGDCPLLVDQPEDNLDNTMVFHVLVDVLRQLKDRRQVIVATHNPNIPVSGDAEQVIVLHHRTLREGEVLDQGAVDLPGIVAHVTEIMEGGEQAFQTRARKYGYDIRVHSGAEWG